MQVSVVSTSNRDSLAVGLRRQCGKRAKMLGRVSSGDTIDLRAIEGRITYRILRILFPRYACVGVSVAMRVIDKTA